jgi:hypothetical protein
MDSDWAIGKSSHIQNTRPSFSRRGTYKTAELCMHWQGKRFSTLEKERGVEKRQKKQQGRVVEWRQAATDRARCEWYCVADRNIDN